MKLETNPQFCVVPSGMYQKKNGKAVNYYKVLQFKDNRRSYVCSLREDELEKIKNGYPAHKLLNEKGFQCLPPERKPAKLPKARQDSWNICFTLIDWETDVFVCVFKRGERAYIYLKTFNETENSKRLKYLGAAPAEKVWQDETELCQFLREHGYFPIPFSHAAYPRKKKITPKPTEPPPTANAESEEERIGYEIEAGAPQAILDRYWDAREFLDARPNNEETARDLYGDDQVDE